MTEPSKQGSTPISNVVTRRQTLDIRAPNRCQTSVGRVRDSGLVTDRAILFPVKHSNANIFALGLSKIQFVMNV